MKQHVIIEGPDGGGKDTLIRELIPRMPGHTLHERASTSLGGPINDLAAWVAKDVSTLRTQPSSIYNRHPLISEHVYRRYRTNSQPTPPEFDNPAWVDAMTRTLARHALLVVCLPDWNTLRCVVRDQGPKAHMPGVYENIHKIYMDYTYIDYRWPHGYLVYNYADPNQSVDSLVQHIKCYVQG